MKLLPKNTGKRVRFTLSAEPGSQVFIAGTFNNWDPTTNPLKDIPDSGNFKAVLRVPPGTHEYKFIVNGVWAMDLKCLTWVSDPYGGFNSVVQA